MMVNNLLNQGAFPEIANEGASLGVYGINVEKRRTIKSAPKADAEIRFQGLKLEYSAQQDWISKLKEVLQKNRGKEIRSFAFFTNQDVGAKQININGKSIDAEEYSTAELKCEQSYIVGQKDLLLQMQNPRYFNIRRNCLRIPADFFCSASEYSEILRTHASLKCETNKTDLERLCCYVKGQIVF